MDCDECKDLINDLMDCELDESQAAAVRMHLGGCAECAKFCEDLTSILDVCNSEPASELIPPNSKALWCRINNVIENESRDHTPQQVPPPRRFWQFSFGQLLTAFVCIAIISSLLTIVGIKNYIQPPSADFTTRSSANQTTFEKVLSRVGLMETPQQARDRRVQEQKAAIDYWNERVQSRRSQWDRATREAFDRNLQIIDESVNDYSLILQKDPDDELTGEMLDSVLNDKMNLLRDFSDL
jgi:hypothetical protein